MSNEIYVASLQLNSSDNIEENLRTCETLLEKAVNAGAKVALLPENFSFFGPNDRARRAVTESIDVPGPITQELMAIAKRQQINLIGGGMVEDSGDPKRPYNTCIVINDQGNVQARYRKIHMFDVDVGDGQDYRESSGTTAGEDLVVTELAGFKFGLSICYDLRFPELYAQLAEKGAEVMVVPAAFTLMTGKDHWKILLQARAIECQAYVLASGQWGTHPGGRTTYGKSLLADPWGQITALASEGVGFCVGRVERSYLEQVRRSMPCHQHHVLGQS